ncbi:tRNA-specific 2-thiouridylase MnmA [Buchnera aphidicola (Drepanosiphum platanoidis)]
MINHIKKINLKKKKKVIIAMSGGVDSSVSAFLLKKKYYVEGLFMKNWEENDENNYCQSKKNLKDAKKICDLLNIRLHKINFSAEYWNIVFKNFLYEYKKGNTPNPDIVCNKEIKFKICLKYVFNVLKADFIATGHYARNIVKNNINFLCKSIDKEKDQTYFLYTLKEKKLKKIIFPIGGLKKKKVRNIAKKNNFHVFNKKSSTGICFIEPKSFKKFITRYISKSRGNICTIENKIIGKHEGLFNYTIGQRKGLKIGGLKKHLNKPWYVVRKNIKQNSLIVAQGRNNIYLMSTILIAKNINWINKNFIKFPFKCKAKIRYLQKENLCVVKKYKKKLLKVIFFNKVSSVTPGQSIVFYKKEICLGGGIIKKNIIV